MNEEFRTGVDCLELLDCLGVCITLVAGAERALINHALESSDTSEEDKLGKGGD